MGNIMSKGNFPITVRKDVEGWPIMEAGYFSTESPVILNRGKMSPQGFKDIQQGIGAWNNLFFDILGEELKKRVGKDFLPKNKEVNAILNEMLDCPPAIWCKWWNKVVTETYINPYRKILTSCFKFPMMNNLEGVIKFTKKNREILDVAIEDGQESVAPILAVLGCGA